MNHHNVCEAFHTDVPTHACMQCNVMHTHFNLPTQLPGFVSCCLTEYLKHEIGLTNTPPPPPASLFLSPSDPAFKQSKNANLKKREPTHPFEDLSFSLSPPVAAEAVLPPPPPPPTAVGAAGVPFAFLRTGWYTSLKFMETPRKRRSTSGW